MTVNSVSTKTTMTEGGSRSEKAGEAVLLKKIGTQMCMAKRVHLKSH